MIKRRHRLGTRQLSNEERLDIEKRLEDAKKRQQLVNQHIAELEQQLNVGTCWYLSPEDDERIKKDVAEIVQQDKERDRLLEIKWYGHELTGDERQLIHLGIYPKKAGIS